MTWRAISAMPLRKDAATVDGYDSQMQTNHLSHFLLTKELLPLLEKAAALRGEARVVTLTSLARKAGTDGLRSEPSCIELSNVIL